MGIYFPIHFVVSMSFKLSSCPQIDSKSNIAKFLKKVCSLVCSILKKIQLVGERFLGLINVIRMEIFHSFPACSKISFQIGCSVEESVTIKAAKGLKDCVKVADVIYMIIKSQQYDSTLILLHTPPNKFNYIAPLYNIDIIEKIFE